jgi:hypothetical protein
VAAKPLTRIIQTPRTVQVVTKPAVSVVVKPTVPAVVQPPVVQASAPVTPVTQVRKVTTKTITQTPTVAPKAIKVKVGVPKIAKGESTSIADKIKSLMAVADNTYSKGNGEVIFYWSLICNRLISQRKNPRNSARRTSGQRPSSRRLKIFSKIRKSLRFRQQRQAQKLELKVY